MEQYKPLNSQNILNKLENTQGASYESIQESIKRLSKPFEPVLYQEEGLLKVRHGVYNFDLEYSKVEDEDKEDILFYANQIDDQDKDGGTIDEELRKVKAWNNWKKVDALVFRIEDVEVDLASIVPKDFRIYFCPTDNTEHDNGAVVFGRSRVYIIGNILTPRSIATLLHEMGHVIDDTKMEELGVDKMVDDGEDSDQAEILRSERVASTFALKVMRRLITDKILKKDLINFLKYYALQSYYDKAKKEIKMRSGMRKHAKDDYGDYEYQEKQEEENRYYYDSWIKWKETAKYKEWKQKEENKILDEFEEYGVWRGWVEKTNYSFEEDFNTD